MSNYYSNDMKEILNSTVINRNIDCSIPCNILLYFMCCCPTQVINYFPPGSKDFKEMFMILLSLTPYPTVFLLICLAAYFRTSRSVLILAMVFLENFTVIALKNFIREPRPNYLCNQEFGYPSNHACFFTCILFWFISEEMRTPEYLQFQYKTYLLAVICLVCLLICAYYYPTSMLTFSVNNVIPYIISAISGIYLIHCISSETPSLFKKYLGYIGDNSFIILTLHMLSFKVISLIYVFHYKLEIVRISEFPTISDIKSSFWVIAYFVVGIILPLGYVKIKNKWLYILK